MGIIYYEKNNAHFLNKSNSTYWFLNYWSFGLSFECLELIAQSMTYHLKKHFPNNTQIASYGMSSVPMLTSIISYNKGQYTGIVIRDNKNNTEKLCIIEGNGDKSKRVVIIDDTICTGSSMFVAIASLENEGYLVEGCICLVNFTWKGGIEHLNSLGYSTHHIFNLCHDIFPKKNTSKIRFSDYIAESNNYTTENGLSPSVVVRMILQYFIKTGLLPIPPQSLDLSYDSSGGICFQLNHNNSTPYIYSSYNLYDPIENSLQYLLSTLKDLLVKVDRKILFNTNTVDVFFIGKQELIEPCGINYKEYGITIQSSERDEAIGGVLPNSPTVISCLQQYKFARFKKARLANFEPFYLYRHKVCRVTERNGDLTNLPEKKLIDSNIVEETIIMHILSIIDNCIDKNNSVLPIVENVNNLDVEGVSISIYHSGHSGHCSVFNESVSSLLLKSTIGAWHDFNNSNLVEKVSTKGLTIIISFLKKGIKLNDSHLKLFRLGVDTVSVSQGVNSYTILPHLAIYNSWNKKNIIDKLGKDSSIINECRCWYKHETFSWIYQNNETRKLVNCFPSKKLIAFSHITLIDMANKLATFIFNSIEVNYNLTETINSSIEINENIDEVSSMIIALSSLFETGISTNNRKLKEKGIAGLTYCFQFLHTANGAVGLNIPGLLSQNISVVHLLSAISNEEIYTSIAKNEFSRKQIDQIADYVLSHFHTDGSISSLPNGQRMNAEHDIFPGVCILALIKYVKISNNYKYITYIENSLIWYKRRFDLIKIWSVMLWHIEARSLLLSMGYQSEFLKEIFEFADWAISHQIDDGSFLIDSYEDVPSILSATISESIAIACQLAVQYNYENKVETYLRSWRKSIDFLNQLMIDENDTYFKLSNINFVGAVRYSITTSIIDIKFSSQFLLALLKGVTLQNINHDKFH